jgi:hypothetical protein
MGVGFEYIVYSLRLGEVGKSERRVSGISTADKFTVGILPLYLTEVFGRISLLTAELNKNELVVSGGVLCEVEGSQALLVLGCGCLS